MQATFQQTKKVGVAGSFINQMMGNNNSLPEVGKGATKLHYTDRTCYEVIEVSKDFKRVKLEILDAKWDKTKPGGEGHQNWILEPTGMYFTVVWKWGSWKVEGTEITFIDEFRKKAEDAGYFSIAQYLRNENSALADEIYQQDVRPQKVVEGITKSKKTYSNISIIFGVKDYYYDWSF